MQNQKFSLINRTLKQIESYPFSTTLAQQTDSAILINHNSKLKKIFWKFNNNNITPIKEITAGEFAFLSEFRFKFLQFFFWIHSYFL